MSDGLATQQKAHSVCGKKKGFGAPFAPKQSEEAGGLGPGNSLVLWHVLSPPQAVENTKITSVSLCSRIAKFLTGTGLAKKGNSLGHLTHGRVTLRTARRPVQEHLKQE